jgi:hypothetical protein
VNLEKMVENHIRVKSSYEFANRDFNWVHTAISNLKRNLFGTYRMVSENYLQSYLNEFTYKLNQKHFGDNFFDRLFIVSVYPYVQHSE